MFQLQHRYQSRLSKIGGSISIDFLEAFSVLQFVLLNASLLDVENLLLHF